MDSKSLFADLPSQPKRSDAFALIIPSTKSAHDIFKIRNNKKRLANPQHIRTVNAGTRYRHCMAKLDFATLLGRKCFSFGSSRWNLFCFPKDTGIEDHHFTIGLDADTLLLTDNSRHGVYLRRPSQTEFQRVIGKAALPNGARLRIGNDGSYGFTIGVADLGRFNALLEEHFACQPKSHYARKRSGAAMTAKRTRPLRAGDGVRKRRESWIRTTISHDKESARSPSTSACSAPLSSANSTIDASLNIELEC